MLFDLYWLSHRFNSAVLLLVLAESSTDSRRCFRTRRRPASSMVARCRRFCTSFGSTFSLFFSCFSTLTIEVSFLTKFPLELKCEFNIDYFYKSFFNRVRKKLNLKKKCQLEFIIFLNWVKVDIYIYISWYKHKVKIFKKWIYLEYCNATFYITLAQKKEMNFLLVFY